MATPTWTTSDGDRFFFRGSARQVREAAYVLAGPEQVKRDLWKAVTDGNVDKLRQYQGLPSVTHAAIGVNSRTGWTIVHEAVERGHSGAMLALAVQLMGSDSVNKKTRTGLTPAHVAASKRDTVPDGAGQSGRGPVGASCGPGAAARAPEASVGGAPGTARTSAPHAGDS